MCISSVPYASKTECLSKAQSLYFNTMKEAVNAWNTETESNCSINDSSVTSIIIKELDVGNTLHRMEFNLTMSALNSSDNMSTLDVSQYDFPSELWLVRPMWEVGLETTTLAPVVVGGVAANLVLLVLLARSRLLRTPTNLLVGSMAAADLLTLLLCPWMLLVRHFYQNYVLGPVGCRLEGFLSGALLITSVMNLCAISYDRLTAIVLPQEARLSRSVAMRLAIISWGVGFIFALPLSIWRNYKERQWKNFLETYCTENINILPIYWHILLFMLVWLPLTIMCICYSAIFWKLDRYEQQILRREHPLCVSYKTRVAKTIFIILVTFVICRMPFTVMVFLRNEKLKSAQVDWVDSAFQILWFISHYLIYLNCAINPIIYGLTNESYRNALGLTPLYKWLSKNTKTVKAEPAKREDTPDDLNKKSKECKQSWYKFGMMRGGKITFSQNEKETNTRSDVKMSSSKITPLPQDYI